MILSIYDMNDIENESNFSYNFKVLFKKNLFNLFIFGCVGSSLLRAGFL